MPVMEDFKKFAFKGNVVDLAVGVIIGSAFGKIVTGLVENVIMPVIGVAMPNPDWKNWAIPLKEITNEKGEKVMAQLKPGAFLGTVIDFLVIALVLFLIVSAIEKAMTKKDAEVPPQEALLKEIRDLLRKQAGEATGAVAALDADVPSMRASDPSVSGEPRKKKKPLR